MFPLYILYGMTEEQFWEKDPFLVEAYRKAHDLYRVQKNQEMWINGMYILKALEVALSGFGKQKVKYPSEALDIFPKKKEGPSEAEVEKAKRKVIDQLDAWKRAWDAKERANAERSNS